MDRVSALEAARVTVGGRVQAVGFREATVRRARELGVMGWVRNADDGTVQVHAEGAGGAVAELVAFLRVGPALARVDAVEVTAVKVEGHEQFAVRGVSAGEFSVLQRTSPPAFELCLQVDGAMCRWLLPKGPSLDPASKRFAIQASGPLDADSDIVVWDRGLYEQGGRVAWPEALDRGHAVFVLHGEKLSGGFALQRTRASSPAQWLLIKRLDDHARPGSDVVAERPGPVSA